MIFEFVSSKKKTFMEIFFFFNVTTSIWEGLFVISGTGILNLEELFQR